MKLRDNMYVIKKLVLFRNILSRSRENPGDLENRHEYFRYVMYSKAAGHKKCKKDGKMLTIECTNIFCII